MKKIYFGLFFFAGFFNVFSQEVYWQRNIISDTQNFLSGITTTLDRQFLVFGSSINTSQNTSKSNSSSFDFHLVKLNQKGNPIWEKYFGGNDHDFLTATTSTQEGGFLIAGNSFSNQDGQKKSNSSGGADAWIMKISENGEEEWQTSIGTPYNDEVKAVIQSSDLGYFVAGNIQYNESSFGSKDVWILKLDKNGKIIKQMIFGGTGYDDVQNIIPTKDNGCLIAVYSRSSDANAIELQTRKQFQSLAKEADDLSKKHAKSPNISSNLSSNTEVSFLNIPSELSAKNNENFGQGDYWIIKLDKDGKIQWQKNYGGKDDDQVKTLSNTSNGFIVGGESRSKASGNKKENTKEGTDIWLIALDGNGEEIWQKSLSYGNRDVLMSLNTIYTANSETKGFLLGGYTQAEEKKESKDETFWMMYLDQNGQEVWRKLINGKSKNNQERLVNALLNQDGTYTIAGTSAEELGKENWKILMLGDKQVQELIEKKDLKVYPNPVDEYCYVEIGTEFKVANIELYNMAGQLIQIIKTNNPVTQITTRSLPQGVYIVSAKTENNILNAKLIKK